MPTEIAVALITFVGSTIGAIISAIISAMISNKVSVYRIEQLEKKVEKHNNLIDRVYRLEEHDAVFEEEIKVANHRISDLEQAEKA